MSAAARAAGPVAAASSPATRPAPVGQARVEGPLAAPRVPADASILPPARDAVTADEPPDCEDCENTGREVYRVKGGTIVYLPGGCRACGRGD